VNVDWLESSFGQLSSVKEFHPCEIWPVVLLVLSWFRILLPHLPFVRSSVIPEAGLLVLLGGGLVGLATPDSASSERLNPLCREPSAITPDFQSPQETPINSFRGLFRRGAGFSRAVKTRYGSGSIRRGRRPIRHQFQKYFVNAGSSPKFRMERRRQRLPLRTSTGSFPSVAITSTPAPTRSIFEHRNGIHFDWARQESALRGWSCRFWRP